MKEHRDADRLREYYHENGLSLRDTADKLNTTKATIQKWMKRHDIERRKEKRKRPAPYSVDKDGYEIWQTMIGSKNQHFGVHRLVAISEFGIEAVVGNDVHHKNEIPWDNRPENLELMTRSEHMAHHEAERREA